MTREQLITENEALHGLLAHACEALAFYADGDLGLIEDDEGYLAWKTLAQIKEGVVP